MRHLALLAVLLVAAWPADAATGQDDCQTGGDAPDEPGFSVPLAMPIACDGAIEESEGDAWDIYAVTFTEGPVYADLMMGPGGAFHLCIVEVTWASAACSDEYGSSPERLEIWWPAAPALIVVLNDGGRGPYHLSVGQQDDCGTGIDALWQPAAPIAEPYARCEALLDVFTGDSEDAFLVPPPAIPDVVIVRMEPQVPRLRLCVDDAIHALGLRGRCTDATFSRILVARDTLAPMRVTVEGFSVEPFPYTLIVENAAEHPPQVPPLL